jgi:hypothetical protein
MNILSTAESTELHSLILHDTLVNTRRGITCVGTLFEG